MHIKKSFFHSIYYCYLCQNMWMFCYFKAKPIAPFESGQGGSEGMGTGIW